MCILGKSPDEAINNIAKRMNVSKNQAGRLIMTESAYFASAAQKDCFNDLDVEKYEIVATLDSHTSEICQEMDGKVFDMKDFEAGVTAPPFHVWCRSTTVPYFDDFDEGATRAARSEDGKTYQVSADMKYDDWKEKFVDNTREQRIIKLAKGNGIRGKINIPPKRINTSGYSFDDAHINEIRKHNVSLEDAQHYIDNALVSFTRYNGKFECYFSSDGGTYIDVQNKNIRTAFKREQYDPKTLQFIKGVENINPLSDVE